MSVGASLGMVRKGVANEAREVMVGLIGVTRLTVGSGGVRLGIVEKFW